MNFSRLEKPLARLLNLVLAVLIGFGGRMMAEDKITSTSPAVGNDIIRLPKMSVHPAELPSLGECEIFSKQGLDQMLAKRYPGTSFKGQPPWLDNYARLMYADERRLASITHYKDLTILMRELGDVAGSKELKKEIDDAFLRRPTWRERAMDRNLNSNRR